MRIHYLKDGADFGIDVYYHIKAAELFPFFATSKVFPWAEMSIWKTHFYDKELGFHFIIFMLLKIQNLFNSVNAAPFNFISLFFSGSIIVIFSVWSWKKCRKIAFAATPLLVFLSAEFFQKLITIRPYLLSVFFFSLIIFLILSELSNKRKIIYLFIIGWFYSLCYSVSLIMLLPVFLLMIIDSVFLRKNLKTYFYFFVSGFLGIAAGLTIHPQFPNTYIISYIQICSVLLKTIGISQSTAVMATELNPPTLNELFYSFPVFVLFLFNILMFIANKKKQEKEILLLILNIILLIGFIISKRSIEYLVPVETIAFIYFIANLNKDECLSQIQKIFINIKTSVSMLVILFLLMFPVDILQTEKLLKLPVPCYKFGEWQRTHLQKNSYIGLLNWGDFPRMFYVAADLKYSMALDPMFSYYLYPERTDLISDFLKGKNQKITPAELSDAFGTTLVYIPNYYIPAAYYLVSKGSKIIYSDFQGCLVKLM